MGLMLMDGIGSPEGSFFSSPHFQKAASSTDTNRIDDG